jgi:exodeoxyribonuclease V alpha subunit
MPNPSPVDPAIYLRVAPLAGAPALNIHESIRRGRLRPPVPSLQADTDLSDALPAPEVGSVTVASAAPSPAQGKARLNSALDRLRSLAARQFADDDVSSGGFSRQDDEPRGFHPRNQPRPSTVAVEEFSGTLASVKVFNDWALGNVWTAERKSRRVTGAALIGLTEGLEYVFRGSPRVHPTHGESLEIVVASPTITNDDAAIGRYLVKSFDGIGKAKAAKYLKRVREEGGPAAIDELRQRLLTSPWELDLTAIAGNAAFAEGEDPQEQARQMAVARNIMLRAGGAQGVREGVAKDLAAWLIDQIRRAEASAPSGEDEAQAAVPGLGAVGVGVVDQTWAALALNPYAPIRFVSGYGFATAEAVARVVGTPRDAQCRLSALVAHATEVACERRGHTYLTGASFKEAMLQADPQAPAKQALVQAIRDGCVMVEGDRIYLPHLLAAEKGLAKSLARLMVQDEPLSSKTRDSIREHLQSEPEKINEMFADGFDAAQIDALASILTSGQRLHVLTGGPGTGKTTIVQALVSMLPGRSFAFAAPTGMAAKVLSERIKAFGYSASTVHSLLAGSEESGFKYNQDNPLELDVLVVDESTMNGVQMADAILQALPENAHLIVLGDPGLPAKPGSPGSARAGQLPSIAPGRFMQDLLLLPGINHAHLEHTYRNSGGILDVVKEISRSKLDVRDRDAVRFSRGLPQAAEGFDSVMREYLAHVQRDGFEKTMLIMPKRQGDRDEPGWNTTFANAVLREVCNPGAERLPGTLLHLGDRIIVRKNMDVLQPDLDDIQSSRIRRAAPPHKPQQTLAQQAQAQPRDGGDDFELPEQLPKLRVVNGEVGRIGAYVAPFSARMGSAEWLRLDLDDGRRVWLPGREVGILSHSYAGTIHSAQGSEFANVVMVVTPGGADFMNQNMLFTGASRAKSSLSIWGDHAVLRRVAATPMPARNSGLPERVLLELQAQDEHPEPADAQAENNAA